MVGVEIGSLVVGFLVLWAVFPPFVTELERGIDFLVSTGGIAETMSLVSGDLGSIIGPIFLFGFALFLAVPYLAWGSWLSYRDHMPKWLLVNVYGWYFLVLALIQIRFAGQLALFVALFGGLGFVHVAAWVDLASYPAPFVTDESGPSLVSADSSGWVGSSEDDGSELEWPERREAMYLGVLGLGVGSIGGLMTPIKHWQLTIDESMYEAAQFMREYSDERGWEYPEDYVFSEWGRNRVYNWFVNGEARSYGYAQSNFKEFLTSSDSAEWYERLQDRVGFVVITKGDLSGEIDGTLYDALYKGWGDGTSHYRAIWTDQEQSRKVYTPIEGAFVTGRSSPDEEVAVTTENTLGETSFTYETKTQTTLDGWCATRVPYPGKYSIGENNVTVSETDVQQGRIAGERDGNAHWKLDEGEGGFAFDSKGGNHGQVIKGSWTTGIENRAFEATGGNYVRVPDYESITVQDGFTIAAWVRTDPDTDYQEKVEYPRIISTVKRGTYKKTDGYQIFMSSGIVLGVIGDGNSVLVLVGPKIDDNEWHYVALKWDGSTGEFFVDGKLYESGTYQNTVVSNQPLVFGASSDGHANFVGSIDEVQYRNEAIDTDTLAHWTTLVSDGDP